ncbi:MAG TPA: nuclear transport factor 2 family protein [Kofleriaceae bacterium]|nr:nuclear transport factor 2 family protein [Kofleriaceae bacterium]
MTEVAGSQTREVVERLYRAFAARDGEGMAACYADHATFGDPVFPELDGRGVRDMWRMLTGRSTDLEVTLDALDVDGARATARWTARYTFTATGRRVTNRVTSDLTVDGGRITRQRDDFDFGRWARQAFGVAGVLLGWTPPFKGKVRRTAAANLAAFQRKTAAR